MEFGVLIPRERSAMVTWQCIGARTHPELGKLRPICGKLRRKAGELDVSDRHHAGDG